MAKQALQIKLMDPAELKPYEKNPRLNDRAVDAVARSLTKYGFRQPIVVDRDLVIVAGHTRWKAALQLKLKRVPVHIAEDLTPEEAKAYRIADNQTASLAEWENELLATELSELDALDFDMTTLGFSEADLESLMAGPVPETQQDEIPDPPKRAKTKAGDVWILGRHRLMCGDSTKAKDVERLMAGELAEVSFSSPPYDQQRDYESETQDVIGDWDALMRGVYSNVPVSETGQVLVNLGLLHRKCEVVLYWENWIAWMQSQGWRRFGWYVWDQGIGMPGDSNGRLASSHEFVFHFNKQSVPTLKVIPCKNAGQIKGGKGQRQKDGTIPEWTHAGKPTQPFRIADSVCRVTREKNSYKYGHPAMFSVGMAAHFLQSWPGLIHEPFSGAGTTLVAAEQLGRTCYGMEIAPAYCDIIVERWQNLTGEKAKRTRK